MKGLGGKQEEETAGVKTLLGDPKKAIIKLAIPMIFAMLIQTAYNVADGVWVAGLGPEALAAVGFFFPFFMLIMGAAMGIGMGGGAAISRYIGAKDKPSADLTAVTTLVMMVIITVVFMVPAIIFIEPIFKIMGADASLDYAVSYARWMFGGTIFLFFFNIGNVILRAEGDAKRAMVAMIAGSVLNIILDPIFIYVLGFEVAGAAIATVLSMFLASLLMLYWMFIKKDMYISLNFKGFKFKKEIIQDILVVGVPAALMHMSMALMMFFENLIVVHVGGEDGVAVLTAGWRMMMIAILPVMGIATAMVSVGGATFGAKKYKKLHTAYHFAVLFGLTIEIIVAVIVFLAAPWLHIPFTWGEGSERIADDLVVFARIMAMFFPAVALGMLSSSMFQGIRKGMRALVVTLLRTLGFIVPFIFIFGIVLEGGLPGVWLGTVIGTWCAGITSFTWARYTICKLLKDRN